MGKRNKNSIYNRIHLNIQNAFERYIYTYYFQGQIIETPTKWIRFLCYEPSFAPTSIYQYASNLKKLIIWIDNNPKFTNINIDSVLKICTRKDLQEWILEMRGENLSPKTIRNKEATIKTFFQWLTIEEGNHTRLIDNHPYKSGRYISSKPANSKPSYITEEEIIRLINGYYNEAERCLVHFLFDSGLRITEAINLRCSDLPDENIFPDGLKYYPLRVRGVKGRGGNFKERISLITSPVLARIRRYHNSPEYRFTSFSNDLSKPVFLSVTGKKLTCRNINKQMKNAARRAGLIGTCSPHLLRHGAAFSILKSELGQTYLDKLVLIQKLFGHNQISTTEIYTCIPPAMLAKLNKDKVVVEKYTEAKRIYNNTYLALFKHKEKRGHSN